MRSRQPEATAAPSTPAARTPQARTPTRATNPLLALQRGYGNRFVQRLVRAFGTDLSTVTVAHRPEVAKLGALAYTQGERIALAPGQRLDTTEGQELLAHEVAHVVQQRQGRVRPQVRLGGVGVSADPRLETEADAVARRVSSGGPAGMITPATRATGAAEGTVVQRKAVLKRGGSPTTVRDLDTREVRTWLAARPDLKDLIPDGWWIDSDRTLLRLVPLRPALEAVVEAPTDYGTFDLDVSKDVTRLCRAMIDLAWPTVTTPTPPVQQPVPTPAVLPEIVRVLPPAADRSGREAQKPLRAVPITPDNRKQIETVLTDWVDYAEGLRKPLWDRYYDLKQKRDALGDKYYDPANEAIRKEFRKVNQERMNIGGAAGECKTLLGNIGTAATRRDDLSRFMAVYHEDKLQGVVEWQSTAADYISNIAGNPYNIVPKDAPVVGGVAKALVILTITQYRAQRDLPSARSRGPIQLWALNNKVKGIYDYFHFRVVAGDKPVERPPRGQKSKDLGALKPHKTQWHKEHSMTITDEAATELIRKLEPGKWLEVPAALKPYLDLTRT